MAQQLTDKFNYLGGYVDSVMSVETIDELKKLSRSQKFVGLTTTVLKAAISSDGLPIPADFWLSESKSGWELKNIAPIDSIDQMSNIPSDYIPKGFEVLTKGGEKFVFDGKDDDGTLRWADNNSVINKVVSSVVESAVEEAVSKITSGASEAFDTLKEVEDWIKEHGDTPNIDIDGILSSAKTYTDTKISEIEIPSLDGYASETYVESAVSESVKYVKKWVEDQGYLTEHQDLSEYAKKTDIPSLEGYATETFVKNAIAEAELSGGDVDLSGYVTKDDIRVMSAQSHTHANKDVLDDINAERVDSWDNASKAGGTTLDESIVVTRDAGNYKNGMTIEEGTSVLEVLKNFFKTTYYPSVSTKPSASMELKGELMEAYEVGTTIEIPEVSIHTVNGKFNYSNYSGVEAVGGDFYEVKIKNELLDGFENFVPTNEYIDGKIVSQTDIVVEEGVNEIVFGGYAKYNAPSNTPITSDGVSTTQTGATSTDNSATWESGEIVLNKTIKVMGYRNIYFGTTDSKDAISSDLVKSLTASNRVVTEDTILETITEDSKNHNRMIIAVPEGKTLKLVEDSTSTQDLTKLLLITEKKVEIFNENGDDSVIYNVYDKAWAGSFGNETWNIKIKNK